MQSLSTKHLLGIKDLTTNDIQLILETAKEYDIPISATQENTKFFQMMKAVVIRLVSGDHLARKCALLSCNAGVA